MKERGQAVGTALVERLKDARERRRSSLPLSDHPQKQPEGFEGAGEGWEVG